jgi:hypothetical protein
MKHLRQVAEEVIQALKEGGYKPDVRLFFLTTVSGKTEGLDGSMFSSMQTSVAGTCLRLLLEKRSAIGYAVLGPVPDGLTKHLKVGHDSFVVYTEMAGRDGHFELVPEPSEKQKQADISQALQPWMTSVFNDERNKAYLPFKRFEHVQD